MSTMERQPVPVACWLLRTEVRRRSQDQIPTMFHLYQLGLVPGTIGLHQVRLMNYYLTLRQCHQHLRAVIRYVFCNNCR